MKKSYKVVDCISVTAAINKALALTTHDALYLTVAHFYKVLRVIAYEGVGEVPEVGADHAAYAVSDGLVVVIEHLNYAVITTYMVPVMDSGFVSVWGALAAVGVDDITAKGTFNLYAVSIWQCGTGSKYMFRTVVI